MRHAGLHITGDHGRHGAFVFPDYGPDLAGAHDGQVGRFALDDLLDLALMRSIPVGVQQGDDDRLAIDRPHALDRGPHAVLIDGHLFRAVRQHASAYLEHLLLRHQRDRPPRKEIVGIRHFEPGDLQHVLEVLGRKQAEVHALPLNDRVHADRGAVREIRDLAGRNPVAVVKRRQAGNDFLARPGRGRKNLQRMDGATHVVEGAEVGKGAADIDANSIAHYATCS